MKKIAISVAACMVLSGNMYGEQNITMSQINPFEIRQAQKDALNTIKEKYTQENVPYTTGANANHSVYKGTNLSGQCVSFTQNSRPELSAFTWDNAEGGPRAAYSHGFHVDNMPRIGAAFVRTDSPYNEYGHTGIVTSVKIIQKDDGTKVYQFGITDANRNWNGKWTKDAHGNDITTDGKIRDAIWEIPYPDGVNSMQFIHEKENDYIKKLETIKGYMTTLYDKRLLAREKEDGTVIKIDEYISQEYLKKFLLFTNEQMTNFLDLIELYKTELGRAIRPNAWEGKINELLLGKNKDYFLNELKKTNEWQTKHPSGPNIGQISEEETEWMNKFIKERETPNRNDSFIKYREDQALQNALNTKAVDTTKKIETTRKLEIDRQLSQNAVDIFFLADNTGSMGGVVDAVKSNVNAILTAIEGANYFKSVNFQYGVGHYADDPVVIPNSPGTYELLQKVTNNKQLVADAINKWDSNYGYGLESPFYAIQQILTNGAGTPRYNSVATNQDSGFRTGVKKVIVIFGDEPSYQNAINEKELRDLLKKNNATLVFIDSGYGSHSLNNSGNSTYIVNATENEQMDGAAQELADYTNGSYFQLIDTSKVQDAVLLAIYDSIADNKWTGGMISKIDGNDIWRVRTPSSVIASTKDGGDTLTFTLRYPNQIASNFTVNTTTTAQVIGTGYYQGSITDAANIFGQDMSSSSVFHSNTDLDFFRFILKNDYSVVEGYYGERLSSSSKLPTSGVSTYDIRERVVSPYTKTSYASDTMKLFVNWATGKVYGFDTNTLMDSVEGTAIFVGDIDRAALEISGNYTFKTRRLSVSENSNLPRVIKDAMRDTTTLQLYGNAYPNGMGGTFGATYYSESGTPSLSSMMMSGYVNTKTVAKSYTPSDGEVWSGHAVGFVANRSTGAVAIDSSTTTDDVQMTLKPSTGEVKASITVTDGSTNRTLTTDYTDTNVYVNQNAFVAMKDSGSVPTYAATTMSENDSYNYLSWGTWSTELSASNKTVVDGSRWIAGKLTPTTSMPSSGTATYNGTVQGMSYESGALKTLNGTHTMNANFASGTITGTMNINYASSSASYATTNLNAVSISGNGFAGGLNGTDNTGSIKGSFYGPAANEIGGTWALSKTGSSAAGIFAGKK